MPAWEDAYDMPSPPLNDKGRPKWPHIHQAKVAYCDLEFLGWQVDRNLITEVCVWRHEEQSPVSWKVQPPPDYLTFIERTDAKLWSSIQKAAEINGFNQEEWADAPQWDEVKVQIAQAVFGRIIIGVNSYAADIRRLDAGFYPRGPEWLMPGNTVDLQTLARIAGLKKTNLAALCEHYGVDPETVHTAEGGVRRVRAVAEKMLRRD